MIHDSETRSRPPSPAATARVLDFTVLKKAVAAQYQRMASQALQLFRVGVEKDDLWATYLDSFPPGTNQVYRERREYDCSCCKQFVRAVGNVVAVLDGQVVSIWDVRVEDDAYQLVADALAAKVKAAPIVDHFLHYEGSAGTDRNFEEITGGIKAWSHFFVNIDRKYIAKRADIPSLLSEKRSANEVLFRALKEIDIESIDTVLDLIAQNSLYRGEEHKGVITAFRALKASFDASANQEIFIWTAAVTPGLAHIRNSVIGTLLTDIAEGKPLEDAVRAFESKVAPANYKRPTALITQKMINSAKEKLSEMGLTSALERRFATIDDLTINNILFADRESKRAIAGDVFDDIAPTAPAKVKSLDKLEEVPIEKFLAEILPRAESVEVLLENRHTGNFTSLITASDPTAKPLFKWDNRFSWSYAGELADSIKEKVKKAGGNVNGDLCCRLAWFNFDDLDLHLIEPSGYEIYFRNKVSGATRGTLDVDMNAGSGQTREPVENIFYASRSRMQEGIYKLFVHQFNKRESVDVGFEVEFDFLGDVQRFSYAKGVPQDAIVVVANFKYTRDNGIEILESLPSSAAVRTIWGLPTQSFHKVKVMALSPNHWDGQGVGNKHYFFFLQGCENDGTARGFFNEFLKSDLDAHRKVFEVVGSRMKAEKSPSQLSGLGFSSTQRNSVVCRVRGSFTRQIKVVF